MERKGSIGKIESLLVNEFVQAIIIIITNILFFSRFSISSLLSSYFKMPLELSITDIIAILTVLTLSAGVLYYAGTNVVARKEYRLTNLPFNFKDKLVITGTVFIAPLILTIAISKAYNVQCSDIVCYRGQIFFIVLMSLVSVIVMWFSKREDNSLENLIYLLEIYLAIFVIVTIIAYFYSTPEQILIWYVLIISLLLIGFGYLQEKNRPKNNKLTLRRINHNEPMENLELFDITDTDYRFKDMEGNELIIPIGQVQEIIYTNAKEHTEEKANQSGDVMNESEQWNMYFTAILLFLTWYTVIKDALANTASANTLWIAITAGIFTAIIMLVISFFIKK